MGPIVERGLVAELLDGEIRLDLAAVFHDEAQRVGGPAHDREIELPLAEHGLGLGLFRGVEHHEHALLAFGQHHLIGRHAGLAGRHMVEVEFDAEVALGAHLDGRRREARRAHVLDRDDGAGRHEFEAGFEQQLLGEGVADLHGRALAQRVVVEGRRRHGGPADAVAPRLRAEIHDGFPDARGLGIEDAVRAGEAHRHGVDQDVAVVARVERDAAADRRHPETVAVAADARHDAAHEMARLRVVGRAEAQHVEAGDRPRPHGEDVAQDAADPRGGPLVGLDEGGVVVALHLEHAGEPVADIDHAGILARPLDDVRRLWWAGRADAAGRTCRSSARSTSPTRCRVRSSSGCGRRSARRNARIRRASGRAP